MTETGEDKKSGRRQQSYLSKVKSPELLEG